MSEFKYNSVLLIDDSYVDNLINKKILQNKRFARDIKVISLPDEALDYLSECATTGNFPDVIFLDIRMPLMNGFVFLKNLLLIKHLDTSKLNLYMLSSSLDPGDLKRVKENPIIKRYISKPLTDRVLEEI